MSNVLNVTRIKRNTPKKIWRAVFQEWRTAVLKTN